MKKAWLLLLLFGGLLFAPQAASAQGDPPDLPVYIVQPGDTLYGIARYFGLTLDELLAANQPLDPNQLAVGQEIRIPGLEGVHGVLSTHTVALGESYRSLLRRYQVDETLIRRLNRIASPTELYVGYALILPETPAAAAAVDAVALSPGETALELAASQGRSPWEISLYNRLPSPSRILPLDTLYLEAEAATAEETSPAALPAIFRQVSLAPQPLYQGATAEILIQTQEEVQLAGQLGEYRLHFFPLDTSAFSYVSLQGVHGMLEPGIYPLSITARTAEGEEFQIQQRVLVADGGYYSETLLVPAETIDPDTDREEFAWLYEQVTRPPTPERYWDGIFANPSYFPDCFTSRYGTRRLYKGAGTDLTYNGYHSGLDFCGGEGLPISAPAAGRVIFSGPLTIRGNATLIDHGWGVYTGYWHQSETYVQAGDWVDTGQLIGRVGGTGRVTGAHLHWEVWVNGVQVNPMLWLQRTFP